MVLSLSLLQILHIIVDDPVKLLQEVSQGERDAQNGLKCGRFWPSAHCVIFNWSSIYYLPT